MAETDIAVRVGADISPLTVGLKKADGKLKAFGDSAGQLTNKLLPIATAATAAAGAFGAMALKAAESEKEWQNLAAIAGSSVNKFKAAAFATNQVGISAEKLADISKDTKEKLGEFIATGGGGFKDFFELVGDQIGVTAQELQNLSGPQVLQKVKDAMDAANVPMEKQSFFLESIASDTTALIPLLADHGAQMRELTGEYDRLNDSLALTDQQRENLTELSKAWDLLGETSSNAATFIISKLAPGISEAFEQMAEGASDLAMTLGHLIDSFDPNSAAAMTEELMRNNDELIKLEERINKLGSGNTFFDQWVAEKEALEARNKELLEALRLQSQQEEAEKNATPDVGFTPVGDGGDLSATSAQLEELKKMEDAEAKRLELQQTRLESLQQSYMTEQELLAAKLMTEKELLDQALADEQLTMQEHQELLQHSQQRHQDAMTAIDQRAAAERLAVTKGMLSNLSTLMSSQSKQAFKIGKAAAIANALVNAQEAIVGSYAAGARIGGPILGAAFAVTAAAATAVQIQNIRNTSFGGGGSVSTGGAAPGPVNPEQETQGQPEGGGTTQNISISGLNPGELVQADVIIDIINDATEKGATLNIAQPS